MAVAHPTSRPIRTFTVPPVDAMIPTLPALVPEIKNPPDRGATL
jgi:hypothetical protein